jgi:hypothetical protein
LARGNGRQITPLVSLSNVVPLIVMITRLAPVLATCDAAQALEWFSVLPGVEVNFAQGTISCGDRLVRVTHPDALPDRFRPTPFDHLALRVGDVDGILTRMLESSAVLDSRFTPDGPREISAFWGSGVRFAFLVGPGGVPVELCQIIGAKGVPEVTGLDHLGLRCPEIDSAAAAMTVHGAEEIARHRLESESATVNVRFLQDAGLIWELFDEAVLPPPSDGRAVTAAWAGVAPV